MTNLSLHQQIALWSEAAEGLRDDVTDEQLKDLGKEIEKHAEAIWQYYELIAADAARLSALAKEYQEAARLQKAKSERTRDFLKFALKSNGFTKLKAGRLQISLSDRKKEVPIRPAVEGDFYAFPDLVDPSFSWVAPPTVTEWIEHPERVTPEFEWNMKALKTEKPEMITTEITTAITVKIARED